MIIILTAEQAVKKYGSDNLKASYEKYKTIRNKGYEIALIKTLEQHFKIVRKVKINNRIHYVVADERDKINERIDRRYGKSDKRIFNDEFYEKKSVVYMVTNTITNKKYIGSTARTLNERMLRHRESAYKKYSSDYNSRLAKEYRKYGFNNFKFEILEQIEDEKELRKVESHWIYYFESYKEDKGYNENIGSGVKIKKDEIK